MFVNAHLPERRDSRYRQCAGNLPGFIKSPERPGHLWRGCKGGRLQPFSREGLGGVVQPRPTLQPKQSAAVPADVAAFYRWRTGPSEGPAIESHRLCRWIVTFEDRELTLRTFAQILAR